MQKVLPAFRGLSVVRVGVSPYEIGKDSPAKLFYKNTKKVVDKQNKLCYSCLVDKTQPNNTANTAKKKVAKKTKKSVDKQNKLW